MTAADDRVGRAHAVLEQVADPEIPVLTIADLGILRDVTEENGLLSVTVTPTYSGCPATDVIARQVEQALRDAGLAPFRVRTVLAPVWTTDWISEAGRRKLAEYGIAPPVRGDAVPPCPRCHAPRTERLSAFGSTPCKALYRCQDCREPFEAFKCY